MKSTQNMPTDGQMEKLGRMARLKELVAIPQWMDIQAVLMSEWRDGLDKIRNGNSYEDLVYGKAIIVTVERILATITSDIEIGEKEQQKIEAALNRQKPVSVSRR